MRKYVFLIVGLFLVNSFCYSQVRPSHIFDNNMVLQRDKLIKIWGWASPGEKVTVSFSGQSAANKADANGEWSVYLEPMPANSNPQTLEISGESNQVTFSNILVGDIWLLGGQSNMEFDLSKLLNGDLEVISANNSDLRIMSIPRAASREAQKDFEPINVYYPFTDEYEDKGNWFVCSPERIRTFSGLGYIFGKTLQQAAGVPIGLIDVSRGGTTVEAWVSPATLADMPENAELIKQWNDKVEAYDPVESLKSSISNWEKRSESRKKQGLETKPKPTEPSPSPALSPNFPGSSFNGIINPLKGLALKGIIFHHGYNNALFDSRPRLYAANFNALIEDWRETFNDKNLPFGIIELSAGGTPQTLDNFEVAMVDAAPFIREGQYTAYLKNNNVGYCCAYDQQVNWYHPQKKTVIAKRIARWALSEFYGFQELAWEPAKVENVEHLTDSIIISFDRDVKSSDDRPIAGFAIAGSDRHFSPAKAEYVISGQNNQGKFIYDKSKLVISNPLVTKPVAVRYAWARVPLANLVNGHDRIIPVPQFRTDQWDYPEAPLEKDQLNDHKTVLRDLSRQAEAWSKERRIKEAEYLLENR